MKTLALRTDEKGLELLCEIAPSVPDVVRGDSNRLRQVVVSLLGNAIKFTDKGEVALNVQVDAEDGNDRMLHFTVSDSGIGIAPEKQKLIFQPFAQADNSTTRKYGVTGLGLTISSRLATIMGGKMWVESEVGRGTKVHFTVRLQSSEKPVEVGTTATPEILRGEKVLIVDDNRTNRRILEGMLKRWEMKSTSVETGEEALAQLSSEVKGVGTQITLTYVLTLDDPHRFPKSREVGCFLGLRPGRRDSGQSQPQMHISKEGDPYLRTMLVQGAHYILGPFGEDSDLRRWGGRLAERGGKNAKKRAVVAVARKLAVLLHR